MRVLLPNTGLILWNSDQSVWCSSIIVTIGVFLLAGLYLSKLNGHNIPTIVGKLCPNSLCGHNLPTCILLNFFCGHYLPTCILVYSLIGIHTVGKNWPRGKNCPRGQIPPRPYLNYGIQILPTFEGTLNLANHRHFRIALFMIIIKMTF